MYSLSFSIDHQYKKKIDNISHNRCLLSYKTFSGFYLVYYWHYFFTCHCITIDALKDTSRAIVVDIFKLTLGWAFPKLGLENPTMLVEARREIVPGLSSVEKKGPSNIECHTLLGGAFFTKQRHTRPGIFWSLTGPTCPLIIILSFLFLFLFLRKNNNTLLVAPFLKIHDTIERGQDSFFFWW